MSTQRSHVFFYGYFICQPTITVYSVNTSFIDCSYSAWVFRNWTLSEIVNACVYVFTDRMSLHVNRNIRHSSVVVCHWFYVAVVLLLSCSSTLESETKCETCRELVKNFMEVFLLLPAFE